MSATTLPATELLLTELQNNVLTLRLNRPQKKNALTGEMYTALTEALGYAAATPEVRAVVITGAPGCFTAGNDLMDFMQAPPSLEESPVGKFLATLPAFEKPLIAAVAGPAVGIGTTLLLHCDLAYAAPSAKFRMPFVSLGLCPEAGSSLLLPMLCGHVRAAELLLLAEQFDADAALRIGLINAITGEDDLLEKAQEKGRKLAAQPAAAVRLSNPLMRQSQRAALAAIMAEEGREFVQRLTSPEAAEAFQSFFEKRAPDFSKFD